MIFKRLMDIIVSLIMIIIFSPFMILIALAIKLYDRGPVFYKQDRLTLNGRVFKIMKFRSMRMDSEEHGFIMRMLDACFLCLSSRIAVV